MSRAEVRNAIASALEGNYLDRAISYVAPVWHAQRMRARMFTALAGGYAGASKSRRQTKEWSTTWSGSADADQLPDLPVLRDRSRDLVRNEPIACGAIGGAVTSVVGTGLALQSRVDRDVLGMTEEQAEKWQSHAEREYRLWAESTACDATRTQDIYGLQALVFRAALESGDVFSTTPMRSLPDMPYQTCLQIYEADQVSNPGRAGDSEEIAGGVKLDQHRAPVAYFIEKTHPGAIRKKSGEWIEVPAFGAKTGRRQVLHVYDKLRPGQTRGVPYLAPVIETLKMLGRYTEAELMAAVISGMFTVFIESERGGLDPADPSGIGGETGATGSDKDVKLGAGAIVDLNKGEKISTANPGRPNQAFEGFVDALATFVGVALEIPREVLLKQFTASYSASRAALLEAWKFYKKRRAWLVAMFCDPVYEIWMDEAVATGRISAPGYFADPLMRRAYLGAEWVGDGPISVDPVKDIEAADRRIKLGISTRDKEASLHDGGNFKTNHEQLAKEAQARREAGLDIEATAERGRVEPIERKQPAPGTKPAQPGVDTDKETPEPETPA